MTLVCASHPSHEAIARCVQCGLHLCADCRTLEGIRNFCGRCRADLHRFDAPPRAAAVAVEVPTAAAVTPRSPMLAAVLSLVPGLGQAYTGRPFRGAIFFAGAMALRQADWFTPLLAAFLYVFNLFDAYRLAQNHTEGHSRGHAPLRADDTLFLLVGLGSLVATLLDHGGFFGAPGRLLAPVSALAASLLLAHETRR